MEKMPLTRSAIFSFSDASTRQQLLNQLTSSTTLSCTPTVVQANTMTIGELIATGDCAGVTILSENSVTNVECDLSASVEVTQNAFQDALNKAKASGLLDFSSAEVEQTLQQGINQSMLQQCSTRNDASNTTTIHKVVCESGSLVVGGSNTAGSLECVLDALVRAEQQSGQKSDNTAESSFDICGLSGMLAYLVIAAIAIVAAIAVFIAIRMILNRRTSEDPSSASPIVPQQRQVDAQGAVRPAVVGTQ